MKEKPKYTDVCLDDCGAQKGRTSRSVCICVRVSVHRALCFIKYFIHDNGNDGSVHNVHSKKNTFHV